MFTLLLKLKRKLKSLLKVQSESRQVIADSTRTKLLRISYLVIASVLIGVLYPGEYLYDPLDMPRRGDISLDDIIAPFPITVFKSDKEIEDEQEQVRRDIPPVVVCDTIVPVQVATALTHMLQYIDSLRSGFDTLDDSTLKLMVSEISDRYMLLSESAILQAIRTRKLDSIGATIRAVYRDEIYSVGVLPDNPQLPESPNKPILIQKGDKESIYPREQLLQLNQANLKFLNALNRIGAVDSIDVDFHYQMGRSFIRPNLRVDAKEYNRRVDEEIARISNVEEVINQGDIIIRAGQKVERKQEQILKEMSRLKRIQDSDHGFLIPLLPILARIALVLALFSLLYVFLRLFRPETYFSLQRLLAILLVFSLQLFLMQSVDKFDLSTYLYPVAFLPIILTILFDVEVGVLSTIVLAMLVGIMNRFDFDLTLMIVVVGMTSALVSRSVRKRSHFFRIMAITALTYALFVLVIENLKMIPGTDTLAETGFGILSGVVSAFLVIGILPVFEALFSITTDITLLELSDMNHPLLKRLALEAPGTYHHSITVGNLCEAAAKEIGGNSLLARVGALYHDIGKIEIPEYFVENQLGVKSKHEMLTPSMSSIILSSHVKKGRLLGEMHDIPDDVLNFIEEHHGTMVQAYFYNKAKQNSEGEVDKDKFRYPGPKPQTRETGIAMLADAVEAASRTLDDPKPARIHNLIQRIIDDRFKSGELDECPLTLRDLASIKDAFSQVLMGAFHHRIVYPKKEGEDD